VFQGRVATDPNPINLTLLAQLEARRSRETGDVGELVKAEAALNEAIEQQPDYAPAVLTLASVYSALHRFDEALTTARRAQDLDPSLGALALVGDVLAATGDYQGAAAAYSELAIEWSSPGLTARMAHLDELSGKVESAILQMERAAAAYLASGGVGEEAAWYQVRLGDLNFSIGRVAEADRRYRAALTLLPGYWSAIGGRAKVSAARGNLDRAIELYESAAAAVPRPEVMIALGDLYTLTGQTDLAGDRYATVEAITQLSGGVYDRTLALFLAEHGRAQEALSLAEKGLEVRRDVYGYDTLAWALYQLGRPDEAREAMDQALVLGTRDSQLLFHAGAISLALGDKMRAAEELSAALGLNRHFHPLHSAEAERMLKEANN
jgi:tetratricopeptide (TPR) repeat protein